MIRRSRWVFVAWVWTLVSAIVLSSSSASAQQGVLARLDTVEVNGIHLAYRDIGEGQPLVLLHGFNGRGEAWSRVADELSRRYRLIVPDLRGHGHSTNPTGTFTHRQSALDIYELLDALGVQSFKAMGISTGAMTLLHMATSQPDRVMSMVLIGGTSFFPEQARAIMRRTSPDDTSRVAALARAHSRGEAQARELTRQFNAFKDSYDDMNFTPPYLATIRATTLIIHGDRDRFFPVSIPMQQYESIPRSYLWIVPNGPHVPLLNSDAGARMFLDVVSPFLAGDWGS